MKAKYVMTGKGPIIFPDSFNHKDFAQFKPMSAGRVEVDVLLPVERGIKAVSTFGESVSLKLKPDKLDAELIARAFLDDRSEFNEV